MDSRDSVAVQIEKHLQQLAAEEGVEFQATKTPRFCQLHFNKTTVVAECYDIALLRLAMRLLDDEAYRDGILECLRDSFGISHAIDR